MFELITSGHFVSNIKPRNTRYSLSRGSNYFQLEYCTTSGSEYYINDEKYIRQYGSILFVKPNNSFSHYSDPAPYQCYAIHFYCNDDTFAEEYLNKIPTHSFPQNTREFEQKFQDIIVLAKDYMYSSNTKDIAKVKEEIALTKLKSLILELYLETSNQHSYTPSMYTKQIVDAQNYIMSNFYKDISMKDIVKAAHISESFLYKQFKEITGKTPHEYIIDLRMQYARSQLILTQDSIAEISLKSGFKNPTYLNNFFKKIEGVTPLQYRKNNIKSKTEW